MSKLIGVIGGLGPKATVYFMDLVIKHTNAKTDQENVDLLVYQYSSIPDRTKYILGQSNDSPVPQMIEAAKVLENEKCTSIVIPCNTASVFYEEVQKNVGIPVINIIEETAKVASYSKGKIGLMATDGTIKSEGYQKYIGFEKLFIPNSDIQKEIMSIIYGKVKKNEIVSRDELNKILSYFKNNGCEKVILGCTELSIAFDGINDSILIDSLEVLAKKTVEIAKTK